MTDPNTPKKDGDADLDDEEIAEVMQFDFTDDVDGAPDGEPAEPPGDPIQEPAATEPVVEPVVEPPAEAAPPTPTPTPTPPATPTPEPTPVPAPVEPPAPPSPTEILSQQVAQQNETIQRLLTEVQTLKTSPPGAPAEPAAADYPQYNLRIPEAQAQALFGDDVDPTTRANALNSVVNSLGMVVHKRIRDEIPTLVQNMVPGMVQSQVQEVSEGQRIFNDFYGTYKQFNRKEIYQTVHAVASQVMQEWGRRAWDPQVRDETARRVGSLFPGLTAQPVPPGPGPGPTAVPTPPVVTPAPLAPNPVAPPAQLSTTSRPPINSGKSLEDEISEVIWG